MNRGFITPRPQLGNAIYRTPPTEAAPGFGFGRVTPMAYGLLGLVPGPSVPLPTGPGYVTPITYGLLGTVPWTGAKAGST